MATAVLMHILSICESVLQGEWNRLGSHKARGCVDNDCLENSVPALDVLSVGSFEAVLNWREVLEHWHAKVMSMGVGIRWQELVVIRIRMERVTFG